MSCPVSLIMVYVVLVCGAVSAAEDDPIKEKLSAAKAEHEKVLEKARALLLADMKKRKDAAQKVGDLNTLEKIQLEIKAFENDGVMPKSVSVNRYELQLKTAHAYLEQNYELAVKQYTIDGKIELAKAVRQDLEEFNKGGGPAQFDLLNDPELSAWSLTPAVAKHWSLQDGVLRFDGTGKEDFNLATKRKFHDFVFRCEWRIGPGGDSGIYLRGLPQAQVQIWDHIRGDGKGIGSGGLYQNKNSPGPTAVADKPIGSWNAMTVTMQGDRVTVVLNGRTVTEGVRMEDRLDRRKLLPAEGPIVLQTWGTPLEFRKLFVEELDN